MLLPIRRITIATERAIVINRALHRRSNEHIKKYSKEITNNNFSYRNIGGAMTLTAYSIDLYKVPGGGKLC